jgi:hypothetical protein
MAELMQTSRGQLDRLLGPTTAELETLMQAARPVGRELRLEPL